MALNESMVIDRLVYFDPVVQNYRGDGTYEDTINDKYEDLSMAVDLTVTIVDRYSCGLWKGDGGYQTLKYSTNNGTVSFMNGSNGILTTNYTEISSMNPNANTKECLGIESIDISYQAWFHPQVTIKFVDVRGATVFQPEDYEYYNETARTATSNLYKALFTFPYPIFELVVKGFYGKGVKYHLSIQKTTMEFDANVGNFVITAVFIGYMYGIFTDIPMQYIAIAPYTEKGRSYWESQAFTFEDSGQRMPTFPQLRELLAECTEHLDKLDTEKYGHLEEEEEQISTAEADLINKKFEYNETEESPENGSEYKFCIEYTGAADKFDSFKAYLMDINSYYQTYRQEPAVIEKSETGNIKLYKSSSGSTSQVVYSKKSLAKINDEIKADVESKKAELDRKLKDYNKDKDKLVVDILGFRPTIKNLYELGFAHMSTFMNEFYGMMRDIRKELNSGDERRLKSHYGIKSDAIVTDTEDEESHTGNKDSGDLCRGSYLPPFTAYYKVFGEDNINEMVWPEDYIENSGDLREIPYIKGLFKATKTYYNEMLDAESYARNLEGGSGANVDEMIPVTMYDFVNNGYNRNPYKDACNSIQRYNSLEYAYAEMINSFLHRILYYQAFSDGSYEFFGNAEAINLYKAAKDANSLKEFIDGIQKINIEDVLNGNGDAKKIYDILGGKKFCEKRSEGYGVYDYGLRYLPINNFNLKQLSKDEPVREREFSSIKYLDMFCPEYGGSENSFFISEDSKHMYNVVTAANSWLNEHEGKHTTIGDEMIGGSVFGSVKDPQPYAIVRNGGGVRAGFYDAIPVAYKSEGTYYGALNMRDGMEESFYRYDVGELKRFLDFVTEHVIEERDGKKIVNIPSLVYDSESQKYGPIFADSDFNGMDNKYEKAFLFLMSIPYKKKGDKSYFSIDRKPVENRPDEIGGSNGVFVKSRLLLEGGYYYMQDNAGSSKYNKVVEKYKLSAFSTTLDGSESENIGLINGSIKTNGRKKALKEYFERWVDSQYSYVEGDLKEKLSHVYNESREKENQEVSSDGQIYKETVIRTNTLKWVNDEKIEDFLRDLFLEKVFTFDYYSYRTGYSQSEPADNQQYVQIIKSEDLNMAFNSFKKRLNEIYSGVVTESTDENGNIISADDPFKNKDFFLSAYMTMKSLYDKWLCGPYNGTDTWNFRSGDSDFDRFVYIDSRFANIGQKLNVNVTKVAEWMQSVIPTTSTDMEEDHMGWTGKTMYDYLADLAVDCGGNLIALPQAIGNINPETMFRAYSTYDDWLSDGSCYIFMYPYKQSEYLGDTEMGNIDMNGYSRTGDGFSLTDHEIVGKLFGGRGQNVPAFGVTYAKQNQSYFKDIKLQAETNGTSEAAIAATINIASKGSDDKRMTSLYGQDLYKVFSNYAYECTVETMGNMMIMPPMYFQLNNVPLWKGAYMIKSVKHSITAGNMTTTFTGIRQNKYSIPFAHVDGITFGEDSYLTSGFSDYNGNWDGEIVRGKEAEILQKLFGTTNVTEEIAKKNIVEVQFSGYSMDLRTPVIKSVRLHKDVAGSVQYCLNKLFESGFKVFAINGFSYRHTQWKDKNGNWVKGNRPSKHSYGTAVDINAGTSAANVAKNIYNPVCQRDDAKKYDELGNMTMFQYCEAQPDTDTLIRTTDSAVVKAFKDIGWEWGGAWNKPVDYMHFNLLMG